MTRGLLLASLAAGALAPGTLAAPVPAPASAAVPAAVPAAASAAASVVVPAVVPAAGSVGEAGPAIRAISVRPAEPVAGPRGSVRLVIDVIARGAQGKKGVTVRVEPGRPPGPLLASKPSLPATPAEPPLADHPAEPPTRHTPAEPPSVNTPAEPPNWNTPAEPPSRNTPGEPPYRNTPGEPPYRNTPGEPPYRNAPAEPPYAGTPAEPPARNAPAEPPGRDVPAQAPARPPVVPESADVAVRPADPSAGRGPAAPSWPSSPSTSQAPSGADGAAFRPGPAADQGRQPASFRLAWRRAIPPAPRPAAAADGWETWRFLPDKQLSRYYPTGTWTITATVRGRGGRTVTEYAAFQFRRATRLTPLHAERAGDAVRVHGSLTRVDPRGLTDYGPFGRQPLEILWRPDAATPWQRVGETVTDAAGGFTGTVTGRAKGFWGVRYAGTGHYAPDTSKFRQIVP
ncbi:hypothetical protein [Nonomuraea sp. NPDC050783]|uniref:hypothetical protein n=1 Tax=Nonomuraea sp. NPDC050783 TaxID=3154634 RepID=UPI0034652951